MALGFQDCCNSSSYFYLTGIPASVQEFETYYIETLQGESFCAKYVEIPKLNYSIPTYTLVMMTEFTNCAICNSSHTCPSEQSIFLSQFGAGTIATSTDCYIKTIFPMVVECEVDPPTSELTADGILGLYIIGGVAPYVAYEAGTHLTDNPTVYDVIPWNSPNTYIVRQNLAEGDYSLTVTDSQGNFFVDITCTLDAPPAPANITCSGVAPSTSFEDDGSITINVAGGIPPYTLLNSNGASIYTLAADGSITINNLTSGIYSYTLVETAQGTFDPNETPITCVVPAGQVVNYPSSLCLSMTLCNQTGSQNTFYLTLISSGEYNNRPVYVLNSYSASIIGNPTNFKIRWENDTVGWTSVAGTTSGAPQFATPSSCSSSNTSFILTSSYTPGGTIPLTAFPQNFTWSGGAGYLTNLSASNISLSQNACPVNLFINAIDNTICQNNLNSDATIELTANGGSGGYSFYYVKQGTVNPYSGPVPSPIIIPSSSTAAGSYQVYAVDSSGAQSSIGTFTIDNGCLTLSVLPSSNDICPNWEDQQGVVIFTLTSSNSTGPYVFYWRKQQSPALPWNVVSSVSNTQTITVYGSSNPNNSSSSAGNNGFGTYEFYVESSDGQESTIVIQTLNNISCGPAPLTQGTTTVISPTCANPEGSITVSVNGGVPPYDYILYDGSTASIIIQNAQNINATNYTFNNLTQVSYYIEVTDNNGTIVSISPPLLGSTPEIKVLLSTRVLTNEFEQTTTNSGKKTWRYPIDVDFMVEYPDNVGTLQGILEIKLLTQRVFAPGDYCAKGYSDGYYLGMNGWNDISPTNNQLSGPIDTWVRYMTINGNSYNQPNVWPNNNIDGGTPLNNFVDEITQGYGYYTNYATSFYKHCDVQSPQQIVGQTAESTTPSATINTNFISSLSNCPPPIYPIRCSTFSDFFDSGGYASNGFPAYLPNSANDDFYSFIANTTYVSPSISDSDCFGNPSPQITWTNLAKRTYVTSLNGTLIVDRTFKYGSQTSPITINRFDVGTIRVNYNDYKVNEGEPPQNNNCDGYGLAFQIEVKLTTTGNVPHCPGDPSTPLQIKYYYNQNSLSMEGATGPNTEYTVGLKMLGTENYPTTTFTTSRLIYNIGTGFNGDCPLIVDIPDAG